MSPAPPAAEWLKKVLKSADKLTVSLPDDLAPRDVAMRIRDASMLAVKVELSRDQVHAVLGRLLVLARNNPQVYEAAGYDTFTEYLNGEVQGKYGVGRSTLYNVKRLTEKWGSLPLEEISKVGSQKLLLLAKFASQESSNAPKLLKAAEEKTFEQLRDWVDTKGYLPKDEAQGASVTISGSLSEIKELKRYLAREDFQAYAGTGATMLLAALAEVDAEWTDAAKGKGG